MQVIFVDESASFSRVAIRAGSVVTRISKSFFMRQVPGAGSDLPEVRPGQYLLFQAVFEGDAQGISEAVKQQISAVVEWAAQTCRSSRAISL